MFTGIIEATGKIEALEKGQNGARLRVSLSSAPEIARGLKISDSISCSGCCLTVVELTASDFSADLSGETLQRTSLGTAKRGDVLNLERPLAAGARLGGHFVQGHVDGVGRVVRFTTEGESFWLSVEVPAPLRRYVVEKGSIAIDGISLTVARWHDGVADIAVIPFTRAHTNIYAMKPADPVNLEIDILAKYVESLLPKT
jgi:riboflavin synthase